MITLVRFAQLLDAYGAEPARWPAEEREAALALLARSPEARRQRDEAARLDALLDRGAAEPGSMPTASPARFERVVAAAGASQTGSGARKSSTRVQSEVRAGDGGRTRDVARRRANDPAAPRRISSWRAVAAAVPLAAVAALGIWLARTGGPDPTTVAHAPAPRAAASPAARATGTEAPPPDGRTLAELENYDAPTDDLLDVDGLEVVDALPTLGCTEGDWGCPDLEVGDEQSTTHSTRRILA
jgi:hypothetical protein